MNINPTEKAVLLQLKINNGKSKEDAEFEVERYVSFMTGKVIDDKTLRKKVKEKLKKRF